MDGKEEAAHQKAREHALDEIRAYSTLKEAVVHILLILTLVFLISTATSPLTHHAHAHLHNQIVVPFTQQVGALFNK